MHSYPLNISILDGATSQGNVSVARRVFSLLQRAPPIPDKYWNMKLIIQIPCFNEEAYLPTTIAALPKTVPGFTSVEWLVVDDGSADRTSEVAESLGVHHVVRLGSHKGLARAFAVGIKTAIELGADVIVNTDADNQYPGNYIPRLCAPIVKKEADIVIGTRPIQTIAQFSPFKKLMQRFGSWVVRVVSNTHVEDAPSGFRAISREAAMSLNVFSDYTYTLETIIQAGLSGLVIKMIPIAINAQTRPSRLVRTVPGYILKNAVTIVRIFMTYKPVAFFTVPGLGLFTCGFLIGCRFVYFYLSGNGTGHVQSLVLCGLLISSGFVLIVAGLVADLVSVNRKMLEGIKRDLQRRGNEDESSPRARIRRRQSGR